jgi:hypothetical protein
MKIAVSILLLAGSMSNAQTIKPFKVNAASEVVTGAPVNITPKPDDNTVYTIIDVAPQFPGGLHAFIELVEKNIKQENLSKATKEARLRVYASFIVEKNGSLSEVYTITNPGYATATEVERAIQAIDIKWTPASLKGISVRTTYKVPIGVHLPGPETKE